ncbi:MAG TPA: hypothetical protein VJ952_03195 [Opitutales bacterium]|nr:hypothetical protein [Opitutales bacterium]
MLDTRQLYALVVILVLSVSVGFTEELEQKGGVQPFVKWLLEDEERLEDVPFAEVVEAVSGKKMLPLRLNHPTDAEMAKAIRQGTQAMLEAFESAEHPIHRVGRINEVSGHVEDYLLTQLNSVDGLVCTIPTNAAGEVQHSGYPDLRLLHEESGRVFYIDPKVYKSGSETSSFRTFYFEPKGDTNKILDDATHLILAISHGGKADGRWQFEGWKLVDLIEFRVRLKAEFQASNRDLYREEAVKLGSELP